MNECTTRRYALLSHKDRWVPGEVWKQNSWKDFLTGKGSRDVGSPGRVGEVHFITIDGIREQLGVHRRHAPLNVELADEPGLHDELGDVVHLDADALLEAAGDEYLGAAARRGIHTRAEGGPGPAKSTTRPHTR